MEELSRAGEVARAAGERTVRLVAALRGLDGGALDAPSELPGWSRLTVVCHLRYGATALLRMTRDALAGRQTAYYPEGRARQRPTTLEPGPGEQAGDVLDDWAQVAGRLDDEWASLGPDDWATTVTEPADRPDLGAVPLAQLALARLTEVDVHGTDLGIGVPDWSTTLVEVALPARLRRLPLRRTNHRDVDPSLQGTWLLVGDGGFRWTLSVDGDRVDSRPAESRPAEPGHVEPSEPRAVITGTRRDLLALLLGRPPLRPLDITGDVDFGAAFHRAFPGP